MFRPLGASERWKPVPGFEGRYEVSDHGRVRSLLRWRNQPGPRLVRTHPNPDGYLSVGLYAPDGSRVTFRVHGLVLLAFVGKRPEGLVTRHLDGDQANNHVSNLAYGTSSENNLDKTRHGTDHNTRKTHCPQGHPYNERNTCHSGGRRHCRTCERERKWLARSRAKQLSEVA